MCEKSEQSLTWHDIAKLCAHWGNGRINVCDLGAIMVNAIAHGGGAIFVLIVL